MKFCKEILRFFEIFKNFIEIFPKILEMWICRGNFGKIWKYGFVGGSGAEPTEASENITKLVKKSKENYKILKPFMKF